MTGLEPRERSSEPLSTLEQAMHHLMDPVSGSHSRNKRVAGIIDLHVDDLFMTSDDGFHERVIVPLRRDFKVGSEDKNDIMCVGQRIRWHKDGYIRVDQVCVLMD